MYSNFYVFEQQTERRRFWTEYDVCGVLPRQGLTRWRYHVPLECHSLVGTWPKYVFLLPSSSSCEICRGSKWVDRLCGLVVRGLVVRVPGYVHKRVVLWFLWGTNWIYVCYVEESRHPLWSSGQNSGLHNGDVLRFLWGTNWIYICYVEESSPPLWSSGQSS
jgi:hypothetical protein